MKIDSVAGHRCVAFLSETAIGMGSLPYRGLQGLAMSTQGAVVGPRGILTFQGQAKEALRRRIFTSLSAPSTSIASIKSPRMPESMKLPPMATWWRVRQCPPQAEGGDLTEAVTSLKTYGTIECLLEQATSLL